MSGSRLKEKLQKTLLTKNNNFMDCIEFAKEYINSKGFKIEDENENIIAFKYQMHILHIWRNDSDERFACIALTNFTDITPENTPQIKEICNEMNTNIKQAKLYVMDETIMATAEVYFRDQEDFNFQTEIALRNLMGAKIQFKKLERMMTGE